MTRLMRAYDSSHISRKEILCYHARLMKETKLEPGLLQILRLFVITAIVLAALSWQLAGPLFDARAGFDQLLRPNLPVLLFLAAYTSLPWFQKRMGGAFLPVALILFAGQSILGAYVTLQWDVPPQAREVAALAFMLRSWINFQVLVLFVAWQYDLRWVMITGVGLCLLDAAANLRFVHTGDGSLYPLFVSITSSRMIAVTTAGLGLAWLMRRQREHRAALAEANRKLAQYAATTEQLAVSQERNRLARELHDTLAHSLSAATVDLEAVQALWEVKPQEARQMLDRALGATQEGLTEARRALQSLRASPLEDLGLCIAISELAKSTAARGNLHLELDAQDSIEGVTPEVEQCVYRVAQEAMANVARHAGARSLRVMIQQDANALTLTVADDGRGFDPATVKEAQYGLRGLHERAEMIGAALRVDSQLKQGTTIQLSVPLAGA